ncbi:MAG: RNA 2',3'-cyclic phosphodiesterase [Clostridia bacterium]|nr:RNA 2',3'-cyclic phosphodiesterase [Clostridia bacterium]
MRAFLAVPLAPAVVRDLVRWQAELARAGLDARFVPAHQLHLTLRFFAEIAEPVAESFLDRLSRRVPSAFAVALRGTGAFPDERRPRVAWIGVGPGARELVRVAEAAEAVAQELGLPPEPRPFRPHVTIARIARPPLGGRGLGDLAPWEAARGRAWGSQPVGELVLFRSTLSASGARHEPFGRVRLSYG